MPTNINFSNNLGILSGNSISIAQTLTSFCNEYSMTFDGVSDYFEGSSTFSELDGQSQFSLSMWIKPDALDAIRVLFHIQKNTTAAASQVLVFLRTNGVLDISADVSSKYCRSQVGSIQPGVWNHVLICFDLSQGTVANKIRPFVNGVDVYDTSNGLGTSFVTSTGPIHLGEEANGYTNPFLGKMDEVALWNSDQRANVSDIYNGGLPFDLSTLGTPPNHWYRMGDGDSFKENLLVYSEDLTQSTWTKTGSTISADSIVAPDGLTTADKVVEDISGGSHFVQKTSIIIVISETYNLSVYLKAGERNIVRVASAIDSSVPYANLDLTSGSVLFSTYANTPTLTSVGNDWYRFDVTIVANNAITPPITVFLYNGSSFTYTGDGVSGAYVWGAQLTNSSSVLDYVQTTNSAIQEWLLTDNESGSYDLTSVSMPVGARVTDVAFINEYSMTFDGSSDYAFIGTSSLGITSSITVSAWVKIPTTNTGGGGTNIQTIICEDTTSGGQRNWNLSWRGTGFNYFQWSIWHTDLSAKTITSTGIVPNDGFWHHVMGTYDGTTGANGMKLYIDGVLNAQGTATSTGINSFTATEATIGALTSAAGRFFEGEIDEVAVWDSDESSNINSIYSASGALDISCLNPLSWWRMGDGDSFSTNWTFFDNGSGGNDATSTTLPEAARLPITANSYSQSSFVFDGINDFVDLGNDVSRQVQTLTMSVWAKPTAFASDPIFLNGHPSYGNQGIEIFWNFNQFRVRINGTSYGLGAGSGQNNWTHIVISYDGNTLKRMTNGVANSDVVVGATINYTNYSGLLIGRSVYGYALGLIDEVAFWDSDQSANFSTIYGNGVPTDILSLNPLNYYRMGESATWDGANWTFVDQGSGGNDGTSSTLPEEAKTGDQPYVL